MLHGCCTQSALVASKFDSSAQPWCLAKFDLYEGSGLKPFLCTMRESISRGTMKAHEAGPDKVSRDGASLQLANEKPQRSHERRNGMDHELLASIEREVLGWPGVSKEKYRGGRGHGGYGYRRRPSTSLPAERSDTSTTPARRTSCFRRRSTTNWFPTDERRPPRRIPIW